MKKKSIIYKNFAMLRVCKEQGLVMIYSLLVFAPTIFSLMVFVNTKILQNLMSIVFIMVLALLSLMAFFNFETAVSITLPPIYHTFFIGVDCILVLYFLLQGIYKKSPLVAFFALVQLILYGIVLSMGSGIVSSDIVVDSLSSYMFLVINIIGGTIILFALEYIKNEEFSERKKRGFIALLFLFLGVMNFIVMTNSIEIFFMLFEFTTLFSYLLIAYRGDKVSVANSLRALWMNQVGGIVILLALLFAIIYYDTIYFDTLLANITPHHLIPIALLAIAAFVKGASIPFERWLLGAMVAPTPVSAMLHSATMVKIAPYLIIKLSPAMDGFLSMGVTLFGSFVFFAASFMALGKDYFKEILGLSTIALLALMMALGAIGTQEAINATLILIVFHAISKALLFLQAGILEKSFHLKYVSDINGLINDSKLITFFIVIGFASLTLPSFGLFIGKFLAIEIVAKELVESPMYALSLVFIALGSVLLTLLYFKVVTKLFAIEGKKQQSAKIPMLFLISSWILFALLCVGVIVSLYAHFMDFVEILAPIVLIAVAPILFLFLLFHKAQRVKEYNCGEKDAVVLNMYYFPTSAMRVKVFYAIAIVLIMSLLVGVVLW